MSGRVYVRRRYMFELRKIVMPLCIIVLMAMTSFGLEPDDTASRYACTLTPTAPAPAPTAHSPLAACPSKTLKQR